MSGFHEERLPVALAFGAAGGPERLTDVVRLASGRESRNARWSGSRRRWDLAGATMRMDAAHELLAFFEARRGRLHGFRFRDPVDWKSCAPSQSPSPMDQEIGVGDGEARSFQLRRRYGAGDSGWVRTITKPVADSVIIAVGGIATTAFELDETTGVATLDDAPGAGVSVSAGFAFDTPVRFDADRIEFALEAFDAIRVLRAPIVEIDAGS